MTQKTIKRPVVSVQEQTDIVNQLNIQKDSVTGKEPIFTDYENGVLNSKLYSAVAVPDEFLFLAEIIVNDQVENIRYFTPLDYVYKDLLSSAPSQRAYDLVEYNTKTKEARGVQIVTSNIKELILLSGSKEKVKENKVKELLINTGLLIKQ